MASADFTTKTCKDCEVSYPATPEFFYRLKTSKDGLKGICKNCANSYHAEYLKGFRKTEVLPNGSKRCKKCKEVKPATTEYFFAKDNESGLTAQCKSCILVSQRKRLQLNNQAINSRRRVSYEDNSEVIKERNRKWSAEHREQKNAADKLYRQANQERLKEYHRNYPRDAEKERLRKLERDRRFPEDKKRRGQKRRALKANADGGHTTAELKELYETQNGRCAYCGIPIYYSIKRDVHVEHITPISRNGTNWIDNIALCCAGCNLNKSNKTLSEWRAVRGW